MHSTSRFFTVRQWAEQKPWPPIGGLRHLIFYAKCNGFDAVIRRVGRRILISEAAFESWIEKNGAHAELDPPRARPRNSSARSA